MGARWTTAVWAAAIVVLLGLLAAISRHRAHLGVGGHRFGFTVRG